MTEFLEHYHDFYQKQILFWIRWELKTFSFIKMSKGDWQFKMITIKHDTGGNTRKSYSKRFMKVNHLDLTEAGKLYSRLFSPANIKLSMLVLKLGLNQFIVDVLD